MMPDISMCANKKCPSYDNCYRAQVEPNPYRQSYMQFKPDETGKCEYYYPVNENESKLAT